MATWAALWTMRLSETWTAPSPAAWLTWPYRAALSIAALQTSLSLASRMGKYIYCYSNYLHCQYKNMWLILFNKRILLLWKPGWQLWPDGGRVWQVLLGQCSNSVFRLFSTTTTTTTTTTTVTYLNTVTGNGLFYRKHAKCNVTEQFAQSVGYASSGQIDVLFCMAQCNQDPRCFSLAYSSSTSQSNSVRGAWCTYFSQGPAPGVDLVSASNSNVYVKVSN